MATTSRHSTRILQNSAAGQQAIVNKSDERMARARLQGMRVRKIASVPCVLAVEHMSGKKLHKHHVLIGLHKGVVMFDDDCDRARDKFSPAGINVSFWVTKGCCVYENLPGTVPIACTCMDYAVRGTSTSHSGNARGIRSVNDAHLVGDAGIMGAVLGCKHMMAANQYLMGGTGPCAYFEV